mgnify:FL=1
MGSEICIRDSYNIVNKWDKKNIIDAYSDSPIKGLKTEIDGKSILYWTDIFFKLSKDGLEKRNFTNLRNNNETQYLKSIESMIQKKSTRAEDVVKNLK